MYGLRLAACGFGYGLRLTAECGASAPLHRRLAASRKRLERRRAPPRPGWPCGTWETLLSAAAFRPGRGSQARIAQDPGRGATHLRSRGVVYHGWRLANPAEAGSHESNIPTVATPPHSIPSVSEAELIERARGGDRAAFGDLVERYQQTVFRAVLVVLRSREDAEEVAQDAFVSAFTKLDGFRGDASFKTWILSIAWNRALDRRRRIGQWMRRFVNRDDETMAEPSSGQPTHEQDMIARETRAEVRRLLRSLPPKYREPLLLSLSGDHTFEEIGALLRIPTGTAKWRAMEGRRLMRTKLVRAQPARLGEEAVALGPEP